jgi:hypothetical protein
VFEQVDGGVRSRDGAEARPYRSFLMRDRDVLSRDHLIHGGDGEDP